MYISVLWQLCGGSLHIIILSLMSLWQLLNEETYEHNIKNL